MTCLLWFSLLLFLATAVLWLRSYRYDTSLDVTWRSARASLRLVRGHVAAGLFTPANAFEPRETGMNFSSSPAVGDSDLEWLISEHASASEGKWSVGGAGFYLAGESVTFDVERWAIVPAWFVLILCLLPTAWWSWSRRGRARRDSFSPSLTGNTSRIRPQCSAPQAESVGASNA
jgi:hypothetical protein